MLTGWMRGLSCSARVTAGRGRRWFISCCSAPAVQTAAIIGLARGGVANWDKHLPALAGAGAVHARPGCGVGIESP